MGKFKVGDKVRLTEDNCGGICGSRGDEGVVGDVDGNSIQVNFTTGVEAGDFWFVPDNRLELVSTLTIEAGKFYKTRDGRKVGPAEYRDGEEYDVYRWRIDPVDDSGERGHYVYTNAGKYSILGTHAHHDLIAEWIDEPDEQPAKASNDNAEPAVKPKFKVGDRVTLARSFSGAANVGSTATVGPKGMYDTFVDVVWDKNGLSNGQWDGGYYPSYFDLALDTPSNPAIVCLIEDGQPKPSRYPHVHADEGAASKEAARLASVYKGQKFGVYVLTQTVSEEKIYAHEWQNLAANGNKIGAIKALRELASLDLLSAKKAVEVFADKAA